MVNAQLQFQLPPQQSQPPTQQQQQQIIPVPPPPPPPPQHTQAQSQQPQQNQPVQANFIGQSVPMQYTLQVSVSKVDIVKWSNNKRMYT